MEWILNEELIEYIESDFSSKKVFYFYEELKNIIRSTDKAGLSCKSFSSFKNEKINTEGILFSREEFLQVLKKVKISFLSAKNIPKTFNVYIQKSPIIHFRKWLISIDNRKLIKTKRDFFDIKYFVSYLRNNKFMLSQVNYNISYESSLYTMYSSEDSVSKNCAFRFSLTKPKFTIYRDYQNNKTVEIDLPKSISKKILSSQTFLANIFFIRNKSVLKYKIKINDTEQYYNLKVSELKLLKKSNDKFFNEDELSDDTINSQKNTITDILLKCNNQKFKTNDFSNISLGRVAKVPILVNLSKKYKNIEVHIKYNEKEEVLDVFAKNKKELIKSFRVAEDVKSNWLEKNK